MLCPSLGYNAKKRKKTLEDYRLNIEYLPIQIVFILRRLCLHFIVADLSNLIVIIDATHVAQPSLFLSAINNIQY